MAGRLTLESYNAQCRIFSDVTIKDKEWIDNLPNGCELPKLFKIGLDFDQCLELVNKNIKQVNKTCRAKCNLDCRTCYNRWSKVTNVLIESAQIEKATTGDSAMLQWLGKARLKQTEPLLDESILQPTQINILGLNANQEQEIDDLRNKLKSAQKQLALFDNKESEKDE